MDSRTLKRRSLGKTHVTVVFLVVLLCLVAAFFALRPLREFHTPRPVSPTADRSRNGSRAASGGRQAATNATASTQEGTESSNTPPTSLTPAEKKSVDDEVQRQIAEEQLGDTLGTNDASSGKPATQQIGDLDTRLTREYQAAEERASQAEQQATAKGQPSKAQLEQIERYEAEARARAKQLQQVQEIERRQALESNLAVDDSTASGSRSNSSSSSVPRTALGSAGLGTAAPPPPPPQTSAAQPPSPPPSQTSSDQQAAAQEQEKVREAIAAAQAEQRAMEQTEQSAKSQDQQQAEAEAIIRGGSTPPHQASESSQTSDGHSTSGSATNASSSPPSNASAANGSAASGGSSTNQQLTAILGSLFGDKQQSNIADVTAGGGASEPPPNSLEPDYYNATFSPVAPSTSDQLLDQQQTTVDFYIGPEIAQLSAVPRANAAVARQIETQGKNQSLTVTLTCTFCSGTRLQKTVITYSPGSRSTDAKFKILPDKRLSSRNQENLVFGVTGPDGIVYDNVVVPVSIVSSSTGTEESSTRTAAPPTGTITHHAGNFSPPPGARPVDLTITIAIKDNRITIELEPANADIEKLFAGKEFQPADGMPCAQAGPGCAVREFSTGLSPDSLSQELRDDYLSLASMVSQDTGLYQRLEGSTGTLPTLSGMTSLSTEEQNNLLDEIHGDGAVLYQQLFNSSQADTDLGTLLKALDGYSRADGKPLLVRVEEQSVYLPWQFLHPPGAMETQKFWGFRYELVVDPEGRLAPGYLPGPLNYGTNGSTVFGKYHSSTADNTNSDQISREGDAYAKFLSSLGFANLTTVDSKSTFLKNLENDQGSLEMLAVFTHATNDLPQGPSGSAQPGPEIFFAQNDFVTIRDLQRLTAGQESSELFHVRPLVFLNGCETGTAGSVATGALNFPSTFLDMGARGVIATEAPVWPAFAYDFGSSMMNTLKGSNQPVSQVLLQTRKDFLQKNHNPLGLLYTYYGGVDAALILP
jgi:hypothetical protein